MNEPQIRDSQTASADPAMQFDPSYCEVIGSSDDRETWLAQREDGLGASDMATILGLNPYGSALELWMEKTGQAPSFEGNETTAWGLRLEDAIRLAYESEEYAGRPTARSASLLKSARHPWMMTTLDARTRIVDPMFVSETGQWVPLELKNTNDRRSADWEEGIPEYYVPQVQQQMAVTGDPIASIAVLIGGNKLRWCDVPADEAMQKLIVEAGEHFMEMVKTMTPPEPDGSDGATAALARLYGIEPEKRITLDGTAREWTEELVSMGKEISRLEKERKGLKNKIIGVMKDAEIAVVPGFEKVWKRSEIDVKAQTKAAYSYKKTSLVKG